MATKQLEFTKKKLLSISYSPRWVSILVIKEDGYPNYKTIKTKPNVSVKETIDLFFLENLELTNFPFDEVLLIDFTNDFSTLPNNQDKIKDSQRENIFAFISYDFLQEKHLGNNFNLSDSIKNFDCETFYTVEEELFKSISNQFENLKIRHCTNIFLNHIFCSNQEEMHFLVYQDSLIVSVFRDGKLIFCNLFVAKTEEEILYFILKTSSLLGLENSTLLLYFYGNLDKKIGLSEKLSKIFPNLKAGENDEMVRKHFLTFCKNP